MQGSSPPPAQANILPSHAIDIAQALRAAHALRSAAYGKTQLEQEHKDLDRLQTWAATFSAVTASPTVVELTPVTVGMLAAALAEARTYAHAPFERGSWWLAHNAAPAVGLNYVFDISSDDAIAAAKLFVTVRHALLESKLVSPEDMLFQMTESFLRRFRIARFAGMITIFSTSTPDIMLDMLTDMQGMADVPAHIIPPSPEEVASLSRWASRVTIELDLTELRLRETQEPNLFD